MNDYKSVSKFLNKQKSKFNFRGFLKKLVLQTLICIVLLMVGLIVLRYDKNNSNTIYKFIYENNFNFAKVNNLYQKYLGDILPFQNKNKNKIISVFNENLVYSSLELYNDGIKVNVDPNTLVPALESGIVTFIGEKETYGNTVIVQQVDGVYVWYGNVTNLNINLYDYVSKGETIGEIIGTNLYLVFEQDGVYLDYKEHFS